MEPMSVGDPQEPLFWHDLNAPWWRHKMETFSALLAICAGKITGPGVFPAQRPVTRSFDVFFDLCLNKGLRKPSWGWWFETLSRPLWRHCNAFLVIGYTGVPWFWHCDFVTSAFSGSSDNPHCSTVWEEIGWRRWSLCVPCTSSFLYC